VERAENAENGKQPSVVGDDASRQTVRAHFAWYLSVSDPTRLGRGDEPDPVRRDGR
jgi:hypothetical protein